MSEDRLARLLGGPDLAVLRARLRARFERGERRDEFTMSELTSAERQALEGLLGRTPRVAKSMQLSHAELDRAILRAGLAQDLRAALEILDGPIADRRADQLRLEQAWRDAVAGISDPRLSLALTEPVGLALLKRCAGGDPVRAERLVVEAERVLAMLPAAGISRAQLGAHALGDAHALDAGQPVASLVLRACRVGPGIAESAEVDDVTADEGDSLSDARGSTVRDQWARIGVVVSELAAPVVCLNLPVLGNSSCAQLVRVGAATGEPIHLTLRVLLRSPPIWNVSGKDISVCENASIVALAADRLQHRCAPLICTDGMPGAAQQVLLQQLAAAGARLRYHGDFDWPGVRIGNFVMREFSARSWRFSAGDYRAALPAPGPELGAERQVSACWDEQLRAAMLSGGRAIHEERLAEVLLSDLEVPA